MHLQSSDGSSRITLDPSSPGEYRLDVLDLEGRWKPASQPSPLVAGDAFVIDEWTLEQGGSRLLISGAGAAGESTWQGEILALPSSPWFKITLDVESTGFEINGGPSAEPEILLDLGPLPPYERGDHVWFKTLVENPTQWNHEAQGNDFPAAYYYDPYLKVEYRLLFDMTAMSWMGPDSMARFYDYRCGLRRRFGGTPSIELGLIGIGRSGTRFPAGRQRFAWHLAAGHREDIPTPPTEQDALVDLVESALPLLRSSEGYWPDRATTWAEVAAGAARELMDSEHCWGRDEHGEHLLNYVDGRSDAWVKAMSARGRTFDGSGPCLESALWILRPLDQLQRDVPRSEWSELQSRLFDFVARELRLPRSHMLTGVTAFTVAMGTWQYVYKVADSFAIMAARGESALLSALRREVEDVIIPLAENTNYLLPLQFDKSKLNKIGPGDGHAIAGLFAVLMLDLHERYGEDRYLQHAARALTTLRSVPIDTALQESFLIAQALDAALRLADIDPDGEWLDVARYFRAQTLRMMYWYDDRTSERTASVSQLGMFLACANINYPAFLENIEVDARLVTSLRALPGDGESLKVIDYGRRNNFSFLPDCSPDLFGSMPLGYIPFEEMPILEGPAEGDFVGQEIYGAGWIFRAHLMWDALAVASDREIQIVNLATYREHLIDTDAHSFLVHNPTGRRREFSITLPVISSDGVGSVDIDDEPSRAVVPAGRVALTLDPRQSASLTVRTEA